MPSHFTIAELKKSKVAHLNEHHFAEVSNKIKKEDPVGLKAIIEVLDRLQIPYVKEHRFHETRKWRFDLAILYLKTGIEYEGLMSKKSRHTTKTGYSGDTDKYSQAAILGWKVLRYTALNYGRFETDLQKILEAL